jgi:glycerol-3-phosphate acyltransferase PlsY
MHWTWLALPALGYLLGSFPTGVVIGRLVGRDPRGGGSGNIGASNVTRTLGRKWGAVTLLLDVGKGILPAWLGLRYGGVGVGALAGWLATVGHCYPVWLRFRGGKGVATAFGVMAVFAPPAVLVGAVVWIFSLLLTHIPTIGSLLAAAIFVVQVVLDDRSFAIQLMPSPCSA